MEKIVKETVTNSIFNLTHTLLLFIHKSNFCLQDSFMKVFIRLKRKKKTFVRFWGIQTNLIAKTSKLFQVKAFSKKF